MPSRSSGFLLVLAASFCLASQCYAHRIIMGVGFGKAAGASAPKKRRDPRKAKGPVAGRPASPPQRLTEEALRNAHLQRVGDAVRQHAPLLLKGLHDDGYCQVDNFLPADTISQMRNEAASLLEDGHLYVSESSAWDELQQEVVRYQKKNVMAMSLQGGESYGLAPRMTEYCARSLFLAFAASAPPVTPWRSSTGYRCRARLIAASAGQSAPKRHYAERYHPHQQAGCLPWRRQARLCSRSH